MAGSYSVSLNVYDLTGFDSSGTIKGLLAQMIPGCEGIWHTGIVVYGSEYYYGGGLLQGTPGLTPYGIPTRSVELGTTEIPQDVFEAFVEEMKEKYTMQNYDLFDNNCNHFTNDASQFLTGNQIPSYISGLPLQFSQSPMGAMLMPMFRQFMQGMAMDPANFQGNMNNMMNQMGGGGMGNGLFGGGNPFGGAGGLPNFGGMGNGLFGGAPPAPATSPPVTQTQPKTGHEGLTLKVLPVKTKQSTLYSSASSIPKIFLKLKQLINEADASFLDVENSRILAELQECLNNRKENPNYRIPTGSFRLVEKIRTLLPTKKVFPVLDVLRLLVLHPTAAEYFGNTGNDFVDGLIKEFVLCENPPSEPAQWLSARVVCNLCGDEKAGKNMVNETRIDSLMEIVMTGFESSVKQMRHTAATISFNASLRCAGNSEAIMQLLSAVCHNLSSTELPDDVTFTLLMTLGRLVYKNQEGLELAEVLGANMEPFLGNSSEKIQQAAKEVQLLLQTPAQ